MSDEIVVPRVLCGLTWSCFDYYRRLSAVLGHLTENFPSETSVSAVAGAAAMSPNYFSVVFSREVGESYQVWLDATRVAVALQLFARRNFRVGEVADAIGWRSSCSVQRAFRRYIGASPREAKRAFLRARGNSGTATPTEFLRRVGEESGLLLAVFPRAASPWTADICLPETVSAAAKYAHFVRTYASRWP